MRTRLSRAPRRSALGLALAATGHALLLATFGIAGCDSAAPPVVDVPPVTSEPPVPLRGRFAALSRDATGAVRFTTTDVETGEVAHTPMAQFENLGYMNEMWVSPDGQRALFRGFAGSTHIQPTYIANVDGTEARRVEFFSYDYGGPHWQIVQWSPDSRAVLCVRGGAAVAVVRIGAGNVPEVTSISLVSSVVAGQDTIRTVRGIAWGDDDDHVVVAGSTRRTPLTGNVHDLDIYALRLSATEGGPGVFEQKLTTRPIRAVGLEIARGGRAAVAFLDGSYTGPYALVTESGTRFRPLAFPNGYVPSGGKNQIRWDVNGRRIVVYQQLASVPDGLSTRFSIGVLDSEDPDLEWREYGNTLVDAQTLPFPLLDSAPSL